MTTTRKRFAVNVGMNWIATAVSMVVPFFLTPFVVHHLGSAAYGIWILASSTASYLGLLDLGLRSAVVRYVSKAQATDQLEDARTTITAALWLRILISLGVGLLSVGLSLLVPRYFKIPAALLHPAQITVLMMALGVAVTLTTGVFGAVLTAIHRFDLLSSLTMSQTVARACGVVLILHRGGGLIALAYWELTVVAAVGVATVVLAMRKFPHARVLPRRPRRDVLRPLWTYSATTFVFVLAVQVVINTDTLVIGAFLSVALVTYYAIGSSLVGYAGQVAGAVSSTFTPIASNLEATGQIENLRRMLLRGTQAMLGLTLPIAAALAVRGQTFITLWMGPQYGYPSEKVLRILLLSLFFAMGDATAGSIMMAIDKHKPVARWAVYEAVFNLGLSLFLVKRLGIYGVAWGTSISMVITHLAFWPRYNREVLGVSVGTYLWDGLGKITLCVLPFTVACAVTERLWHPAHLVTFFAQILAVLPVYPLTLALVYRRESRQALARVPWLGARIASGV